MARASLVGRSGTGALTVPVATRYRARTVALKDGARVTIRQIRPQDKELVSDAFERLSSESRYRRFLTPMPSLPPALLEYLTEVDHVQHEALVAIAVDTGQLVGSARYIRDEELWERAEVAVTVTDDWQGRGVGRLLLERLTARARTEGIRAFTALMLGDNRVAVELLSEIGESAYDEADGPEARLVVDLPARRGLGGQLAEMLRAVAAGRLSPAGSSRIRERAPGWPVDPGRALRSVVVGTDGSDGAGHAVAVAVEIAARFDAALHIVSAYDGDDATAADAALSSAASRAGDLRTKAHARQGDPVGAIIDVAKEVECDLIVVGNRGMNSLRHLMPGNVPNAVSHHAPCSVLIVRTTR
jgi:nucleotide-binding universal stress UspA family protein/GNAT superfamily N-acetyltransferase